VVRTIDWRRPGTIVVVDQTRLPDELVVLEVRSVDELVEAVQRLRVRGAPALGIAGALGVLLAMSDAAREGWDAAGLAGAIDRVRSARPTAVNLAWGVDQVAPLVREGFDAAEEAAVDLVRRDVEACHAIGERGADLVVALTGGRSSASPAAGPPVAEGSPRSGGLRLHTHCNAGALACVEWGTALGVVRSLHRRGLVGNVLVDETRPLLQGARLTAWELGVDGIPYEIVVDSAGPGLVSAGAVDVVVVGADRIAANGDVANKVGTYGLALAAARSGVPFVVAAPESTLDPSTPTGASIPIEERAATEVVEWGGARSAPAGARVRNPAFDVTPAELVTAIVTERRVIRPAQASPHRPLV
jgi:S-methyl-5-thioribose-1-phosphate isomerase